LQGLQGFAQRQRAPLPPGKGVIVKEDLPQVREEYLRPPDFSDDIGNAACAPGMAADGLRPQAEGAQCRATARGIKRDVWMQQKRDIILRDIEVTLVDLGSKWQCIEILEEWSWWIMDNLASMLEAHTGDLGERFPGGK